MTAAKALQARWGCPGGAKALSPMLDVIRRSTASQLRLELPEGECPWRGLYTGDRWLSEVVEAELLVRDAHLSWEDALGRRLTAADRDAVLQLQRARCRVRELEEAHDRAERRRKGKPLPGDDEDE